MQILKTLKLTVPASLLAMSSISLQAATMEFQCEGNPSELDAVKPLHSFISIDLANTQVQIIFEDKHNTGFDTEVYNFNASNNGGEFMLRTSGSHWYNLMGSFTSKGDGRLKDSISISWLKWGEEGQYSMNLGEHDIELNEGPYRLCRDENLCGENIVSHYGQNSTNPERRKAYERYARLSNSRCDLSWKL